MDENLPVEIAGQLRAAGHQADTVNDEAVAGSLDPDLALLIQREGRDLITLDRGFGDIRAYRPQEYPGLVVMHLAHQDKARVLEVCKRLVPSLSQAPLEGRLWIVEESRIRVRGGQ